MENLEPMLISSHIRELRCRAIMVILFYIIAAIGSFSYSAQIYDILLYPLAQHLGEGRKLIFTGIAEGFFTYMKLSCFAAFIMTFPILMWQIYRFIIPALYKHEKIIVLPYFIFSNILFVLAILMVYFFVMPIAWGFFLSFEMSTASLPVILEARISEYLSTVINMIISFALAFQMPIILALLVHINMISIDSLIKFRKYVIVGIFIIAAILTPPDVLSQIMLAIPLLILYEITILICKFYQRKNNLNA